MEQRPESGLHTHPVRKGGHYSSGTAQLSIEQINRGGKCFHWLPQVKKCSITETPVSTLAKLSALFVQRLQATVISESHEIRGVGKAVSIRGCSKLPGTGGHGNLL